MVTTFAPTTDVDSAPALSPFEFPQIIITPEAVPPPAPKPARARPARKPVERRLSALIRIGAAKAEGQATGTFVYWTGSGVTVCAMGAAALGVRRGTPKTLSAANLLAEHWSTPLRRRGVDLERSVRHPVNGEQLPLDQTVIDLNDRQHWSLERIADWLESIGL